MDGICHFGRALALATFGHSTSSSFLKNIWFHTMAQQITQRKQQGQSRFGTHGSEVRHANKARNAELQLQYTNYKNGLQQIAQKIGDVEQEAEEHSSC